MTDKPIPKNSESAKEIAKLEDQFDKFEKHINELTLDRMNEAPKKETEPQTKLSQNEIADSKDKYLKPSKIISSKEPFNEKYRSDYEYAKQYVYFIAENKEIIGEEIEIWTKPFAGMPAEFWKVPVNKPIWGPRHLAEQIKRASYHRMHMDSSKSIGGDQQGNDYYGAFVVDEVVNRLDARPATKQKSIFMGSTVF